MYVPHTHCFEAQCHPHICIKGFTPIHNSCKLSISGCKYTSTFVDVTDSFLGIVKTNILKYHLVISQGRKLEFNKITGHVEWHELRSPYGLTPSSANPNLTFCGSYEKIGHLSLMCFQVAESSAHWISPSKLAPFLHQINNFANNLHLYKGNNHEINGKCQITLHGVPANPTTNLPLLHFGHCYACFKVPQNSTHPFVHAWIDSWLNPSIFISLNASYVVARSLFPFGSSSFHNKASNSSMKLVLTPWTVFKLSNINKADNMEVEDPSNNISMNDP